MRLISMAIIFTLMVIAGQALAAEQPKGKQPSITQVEANELIKQRKVKVGMTADMVRASWGQPDSLKKTETCWGIEERWTYKDRADLGIKGSRTLVFEDGKLIEIE